MVIFGVKNAHNLKTTGQILVQFYVVVYFSLFFKLNKVGVFDVEL